MTKKPPGPAQPASAKPKAKPLAEHEQRRKQALRANLARRKQQARGREAPAAAARKTIIGRDEES